MPPTPIIKLYLYFYLDPLILNVNFNNPLVYNKGKDQIVLIRVNKHNRMRF